VRGRPPTPASGDVSARRRALRDEAGRLAADLGQAVTEAEAVNLPVEPGVREARDALDRWAALLGELLLPLP
jgi:hypothetical protein